jgi:hypothetical protein
MPPPGVGNQRPTSGIIKPLALHGWWTASHVVTTTGRSGGSSTSMKVRFLAATAGDLLLQDGHHLGSSQCLKTNNATWAASASAAGPALCTRTRAYMGNLGLALGWDQFGSTGRIVSTRTWAVSLSCERPPVWPNLVPDLARPNFVQPPGDSGSMSDGARWNTALCCAATGSHHQRRGHPRLPGAVSMGLPSHRGP